MIEFDQFKYSVYEIETNSMSENISYTSGTYNLNENKVTIIFSDNEIPDILFNYRKDIGKIAFVFKDKERSFKINSDTVVRNDNKVTLFLK